MSVLTSPTYTAAAFVEALPAAPVVESARRASTFSLNGVPTPRTAEQSQLLPGNRMSLAFPAPEFLMHVFNAEPAAGDWLVFPHDDGTVSTKDKHIRAYPAGDDDIVRVTVYGELAAAALGVDAGVGSHSTFDLLISAFCGGKDVSLAARLCKRFIDDLEGFVAALAGKPSIDELTALVARPDLTPAADDAGVCDLAATTTAATATDDAAIDAEVAKFAAEVAKAPTSIDEAIKAWRGARFTIQDDLYVVVGGPRHGLWQVTTGEDKDGEKVVIETKLVDWIAFRATSDDEIAPDGLGKQGKFSVTVITNRRQTCTITDLTADEAVSCSKVRARSSVGVSLPERTAAKAQIDNMLSKLRDDERERTVSHRYLGWRLLTDGRHVMMSPSGSPGADRIDGDAVSSLLRGLERVPGAEVLRATGFNGMSTAPIREAAQSIRAFLDIAPARPDMQIALLSAMFLAPLGAGVRGTICLFGDSDSLKSLNAAALQCFWTSVPLVGSDGLPLALPTSSTPGGLRLAAWYRSSYPVIADDFRSTDPKQDAAVAKLLNGLIQGSYGSALQLLAEGSDAIRASQTISAPVIFTAEKKAEGTAILNRSLSIPVNKGDVGGVYGGGEDDTIAVFRRDFHDTGMARATLGSYLQWIAGQLDTATGIATPHRAGQTSIEAMKQWADEARTGLLTTGKTRADQLASGFRAAWKAAWLWADSVGIRDLLPSEDEVNTAFETILLSTRAASLDGDAATVVLRELGSAIDLGEAHLVNEHGVAPTRWLALLSGWRDVDGVLLPGGKKAGYWSDDRSHILVGISAAKWAARRLPATRSLGESASGDELRRALSKAAAAEYFIAGDNPKASRALGIVIGINVDGEHSTGGTDIQRIGTGTLPKGFPILATKMGFETDVDVTAEGITAAKLEVAEVRAAVAAGLSTVAEAA